jgi:hypothetical protein
MGDLNTLFRVHKLKSNERASSQDLSIAAQTIAANALFKRARAQFFA